MKNNTLKAKKKQLEQQLAAIACQEEKEIEDKYYPIFKEKYEGRYFKTNNSYGRGQSWPMYTKVTKIKREGIYDTRGNGVTAYFSGFNVQYTLNKEILVQPVEYGHLHCLGTEISYDEFRAAYTVIMAKLEELGQPPRKKVSA